MRNLLLRAALLLLAALPYSTVCAQIGASRDAPAGFVPETAPVMFKASSVPLDGSVTSSGVTPTSGAATFSGGSAYIGPFTPELGRDLRIVLKGTWAGTFTVGTAAAANGCTASSINLLTIGGQSWGSYAGNVNEVVDTPTLGASPSAAQPIYCAIATVSSGTLTYTVRQ